MFSENYGLMTQNNQFFDITHTFKVGSSTYHVLGLRQDRPTYRNVYYIFNCMDNRHESPCGTTQKSILVTRSATAVEQSLQSKHRSLVARHARTILTNGLANNRPQKTKSVSYSCGRTDSPTKVTVDATAIEETFTKTMRKERQMLVASLRKDMNLRQRSLIRSIQKENQAILQATTEAKKDEEIIRLLEEQKIFLQNAYEKCISTTTSSINILKQILVEILDAKDNTSQSIEQLQITLIQTIEQEIQKLALKNEEIFKSTSTTTNTINQLQNVLIQQLENYSITNKQADETILKRLFNEQQRALSDVITQQQTLSLTLAKQVIVDTIKTQQQSMLANSINNKECPEQQLTDNIMGNQLSQDTVIDNATITNSIVRHAHRKKSSERLGIHNQSSAKETSPDQNLFKISIRSPETVYLFAKLVIDGTEYSRRLHTLCQRDAIESDLFNCYIAPPIKNGPYEVTIYAKTKKETNYRAAICIRLPRSDISQSMTFPLVHQSFIEHQCILIEPLQRLVQQNEQLLIHMIIPRAHVVKIRNGDENIELNVNEYKRGVVKKKIRIRGDVYIIGCWDKKTDSIICVFNMA